ncbi:MAG: alkaline phosphatase family protein, partial [Ginsengibacter sp.]
ADHGVAHAINFMKEHNLPAGLFNTTTIINELNQSLVDKFGVPGLVNSAVNYHIDFNLKKIDSIHLDYDAVKKFSVEFLQKQPGISFAVDIDHIGTAPIPEPVKSMIINGYYSKRCGPVIMIPDPGWFSGSLKGTNHGGWNPYDTHIPLVFTGWHIPNGSTTTKTYMTDIAPTIAAMLHIQVPNGSVGKAIHEVITGPSNK